MIYAKFDDMGFPLGFWIAEACSDPEAVIPTDAVVITEEQHLELLENAGGRRYVGGEVTVYIPPAPAPTAGDIARERDVRIDAGFVFEGVHYQSRPEDRENIAGAKAAATDAITLFGAEAGDYGWQRLLDPDAPEEFRWIAADNTTHPMDAPTAMRFGYAALGHKQAHIFAARELKDMDPIPSDYATNPSYWPQS